MDIWGYDWVKERLKGIKEMEEECRESGLGGGWIRMIVRVAGFEFSGSGPLEKHDLVRFSVVEVSIVAFIPECSLELGWYAESRIEEEACDWGCESAGYGDGSVVI